MRKTLSALCTLTAITLTGCGAAFLPTSATPVQLTETPALIDTTVSPAPTPYVKDDGTLVAHSFEQAEFLCEENTVGKAFSDCINAALLEWCEFVPNPPESKFFNADDARCLAEQANAEKSRNK